MLALGPSADALRGAPYFGEGVGPVHVSATGSADPETGLAPARLDDSVLIDVVVPPEAAGKSRTETAGASSALPDNVMRVLFERYHERVFALDHHTLWLTPAMNVEAAVRAIPSEVSLELDLVAHSRGGLVALERREQNGMPESLRARSTGSSAASRKAWSCRWPS